MDIFYWQDLSGSSPVEEWLEDLDDEQYRAVVKELKLLDLIENNLRLPHSRALKKKLFELRERRFNYRVYYCFDNDNIVLLAAGNKGTQESDIELAYDRLSQLKG